MTPRVAVLLPVRNGAQTLPECLESLRGQVYRDFCLIAVDDGSTDDTRAILSREAARWADAGGPALRLLTAEPGVGIAGALLLAADAAREVEYLARQDADDSSYPARLLRQVEYLDAHPEIGVLGTGVLHDRESPTDGRRRYEAWLAQCHTPREIALNLWIESPLPHPTVVMRREVYRRAGGYRPGPWPEDYDLWLRMLRLGVGMERLEEVLYRWRDHPERASRILPEYSPKSFLACRAHHLARFLQGRPVILWGAGRDGRRAAKALQRERVRVEAFLDIDPRKIGRTFFGAPIHAAETWLASHAPGGEELPMILAAVGTNGARELIRGRLQDGGFAEGADFLCLA